MKAKYIAIICLSALTFASCDFFESSSPSALEPKDVFSDATRTEQAIFAVYNLMGSNNSYRNRIPSFIPVSYPNHRIFNI